MTGEWKRRVVDPDVVVVTERLAGGTEILESRPDLGGLPSWGAPDGVLWGWLPGVRRAGVDGWWVGMDVDFHRRAPWDSDFHFLTLEQMDDKYPDRPPVEKMAALKTPPVGMVIHGRRLQVVE